MSVNDYKQLVERRDNVQKMLTDKTIMRDELNRAVHSMTRELRKLNETISGIEDYMGIVMEEVSEVANEY